MKLLKRWLAFFVVVVLVISVAFNSRGPLRASHIGEENTTTNNTGELEGQTAEDTQQAEGDTGENTEQGEPAPDASTAEQPEVQEETPAEPEAPHQDEMELSQVMTGENGEAVCKVTANIPEGTFEANTADVTMEVTYAAADTTEQIKTLMSKAVAEGNVLGNYFLYNVIFKVNGEQVEPGKEIKITFEQNNFQIKDTKKATTFYYNEANSVAGNAEAEIVKITQKSDKIEELQNAGESIDNIDDYDLSEISLKEDNLADKIMMEGRRSTIYGCYVDDQKPQEEAVDQNQENKEEKTDTVESFKYEDDDVVITVTPEKTGIIPEKAKLQVLPIVSDKNDTKDQYKEVEEQLKEKAENEEYDIAGFLAYDISFIGEDGKEVEPAGNVKVSMDYKKNIIPEEVKSEDKDLDVTVMHLEEDEKGNVKNVVDMVADSKTEAAVETTNSGEVKKAEFVTDSFSIFTITWNSYGYDVANITVHYVDESGNEIDGSQKNSVPLSQGNEANLTSYNKAIDGYTFDRITATSLYGENISKLRYATIRSNNSYKSYIQYNTGKWTDGSFKESTEWENWKEYNNKIITGDVFIVYNKNASVGEGDGGTGGSSLGSPEHYKRIKYNEKDKDYTLSLDVQGKRGKKTGVDVLFIIDKSGSMGSGWDSSIYFNLMPELQKTVPKLVDTILPDSNSVNRVAAVSFSTGTVSSTDWCDFKSKQNLKDYVSKLNPNGGTNWQSAMRGAESLLSKQSAVSSQNKKVVLFLSDGVPTYYYGSNGGETTGSGTGSSFVQTGLDNAVNDVVTSTNLKNAEIYSVYLTSGTTKTKMTEFATKLQQKNINAHAQDGTIMESALKQMIDQILTPAYQNVVIEDTLSEYVQFSKLDSNGNPVITVTKTDKSGKKSTLATSQYKMTYSKNEKKISVSLLNGGELEEGVTYTVSFNVKPTEEAEKYFNNHVDYPHVGDEDTDAEGNKTSSGQKGFYSNKTAVVKYKENKDSIQVTADYLKPVVQVDTAKCDFIFYKVNTKDEGISGAKFLLVNDKISSIAYEQNSSTGGKVTFNNLVEGTYTLTETVAPDNYVKVNEEWKVKVEKNSEGNLEAKLYHSDGSTLVENQKIINYTEKEEAVRNVISDKKASVTDENNRIFQIDLNASTSGREEGVEAQGASIVLVLDASDSMKDSGMTAIKKAATSFINKAKESSPISEVGVIFYKGTEGSNPTITSTDTFYNLKDNYNNLYNFINDKNKTQSGGTPMGAALDATNTLFNQAQYNNKYVLFFTDGAPGYWEESGDYKNSSIRSNCMVANHAYNEANEIKQYATIYTIGYNLKDSFSWNIGHSPTSSASDKHSGGHTKISASDYLAKHIASTSNDGKKYAYTTDDIDELGSIFDEIAGQIGELYTVHPDKIVDVIDARFKLTTESKNKLEKIKGVTVTENADGTTTITWTGDAAIIGNKDSEDPKTKAWSASFQIQAKDDFIGGNMVPTNGIESGIYIDGNLSKQFEQPSVNVKLLSLSMDNEEITVYKGDVINPVNFADDLDKTLNIVELDKSTTTNTGKPKFPALTETQKKELEEKGTVEIGMDKSIEYTYPNTNEAVGYFVYTYKIPDGSNGNMAEHQANETEVYELNIKFIPYTVNERAEIPELGNINKPEKNGGTELNQEKDKLEATGKYVVKVISGELKITKKLDEPSLENQTFTFNISNKDSGYSKDVSLIIPSGKTEANYTGSDLKNLSRGSYEVTEKAAAGYSVQNIQIGDKTNCYNTLNEETATFDLGYEKQTLIKTDVIKNYKYDPKDGGTLGEVIFTNEKVTLNWDIVKVSDSDPNHSITLPDAEFVLTESSSGIAPKDKYYGKSNSKGKLIWYMDENHETVLKGTISPGTYILTETKAPAGYAISNVTWEVKIASNGGLKSITSGTSTLDGITVNEGGEIILRFYYENTPLYDLPSAGGPGIFWYTVGGTLLMCLAGLLTLYKNKRKRGVGLSK